MEPADYYAAPKDLSKAVGLRLYFKAHERRVLGRVYDLQRRLAVAARDQNTPTEDVRNLADELVLALQLADVHRQKWDAVASIEMEHQKAEYLALKKHDGASKNTTITWITFLLLLSPSLHFSLFSSLFCWLHEQRHLSANCPLCIDTMCTICLSFDDRVTTLFMFKSTECVIVRQEEIDRLLARRAELEAMLTSKIKFDSTMEQVRKTPSRAQSAQHITELEVAIEALNSQKRQQELLAEQQKNDLGTLLRVFRETRELLDKEVAARLELRKELGDLAPGPAGETATASQPTKIGPGSRTEEGEIY